MTMKNVDVSFARCCPCFISLLKEAIYDSKPKNDTSILLFDYIVSLYEKAFATETFVKSGTILFTCFEHLLETFCLISRYAVTTKRKRIFL